MSKRIVRTEDELMELSNEEMSNSFVQFSKVRFFPKGEDVIPFGKALAMLTPNDFWWYLDNNYIRVWVNGRPSREERYMKW